MESDRYVCEICKQSFQREQNLQMHRRRHKVPWKLLKRGETEQGRKRAYVCPEPTCLHHDPLHALGDLVGIKKHYKRKHSNKKQWVCERCSKGYAVHSDFKAHLKICGTRGHSCDCGRVFSRVEAFIEHQDTCKPSQTNFVKLSPIATASDELLHSSLNPYFQGNPTFFNNHKDITSLSGRIIFDTNSSQDHPRNNDPTNFSHNLELQLFSSTPNAPSNTNNTRGKNPGLYENFPKNDLNPRNIHPFDMLSYEACEMSRMAIEEKALADEKREQAKCLIGLAMMEMAKAKAIKEEAIAELNAAHFLKECSVRRISSTLVQIKCNVCRREFQMMFPEGSCAEAFFSAPNS